MAKDKNKKNKGNKAVGAPKGTTKGGKKLKKMKGTKKVGNKLKKMKGTTGTIRHADMADLTKSDTVGFNSHFGVWVKKVGPEHDVNRNQDSFQAYITSLTPKVIRKKTIRNMDPGRWARYTLQSLCQFMAYRMKESVLYYSTCYYAARHHHLVQRLG